MVVFLGAGVFAGCSANSETAEKNDKTTITVWGMGEEAKSLPTIAKEFERDNPDIKVKVQTIPWDTAHNKLLTAVASKKGPDVVQMGTSWIPEFAAANVLMDLKPYIEQYPEFKEENFFNGSLETTAYENKIVGIPWYIDTRVLFYRTDILKEAGYDEAPKTWDELREVAKKLAERGDGKYGFSIDAKDQNVSFMYGRQNDSELFDKQNKPLFNQKEFVEAVEYLNGFYEDGSTPREDLALDTIQAFRGDAIFPMFTSGPWNVRLLNDQAPELEGKWATAVLPEKENNISALGGANLSVFEYSKNKDAALKFIAFMSTAATQVKWMEMTNALPAVKEAWNDQAIQGNSDYKIFEEQMKQSQTMPMIPQFEEIAQLYLKHYEQIYRGGANVQEEMDSFNKKVEDILSK